MRFAFDSVRATCLYLGGTDYGELAVRRRLLRGVYPGLSKPVPSPVEGGSQWRARWSL